MNLKQLFEQKTTVKLEEGTVLAFVKYTKECEDVAMNVLDVGSPPKDIIHEGHYFYRVYEIPAPVTAISEDGEIDGCQVAVRYQVKSELPPVTKKLQASTSPVAQSAPESGGGCKSDGSSLLPFLLLGLVVVKLSKQLSELMK